MGSADGGQTDGTAGDDTGRSSGGSFRERLYHHRVHLAVVVGFVAYPVIYTILVTAPVVGPTFAVFMPRIETMIAVLYIGLFAVSFDFISGYTGYLSFGHALFYGIGAYFVIMAAEGLIPGFGGETPFFVLMLAGAILATLVALAVGAVSFRLTGVYFAMVTLGFAEIAYVLIRNWNYLGAAPQAGIQHGEGFAFGVPYVEALQIQIGSIVGESFHEILGPLFGMSESMARASVSFWLLGVLVLVCYFVLQRIVHSPFGQVMIAIRENEERARAIGYNTYWYKMGAFAISGFFAAIAGAIFAGYRRQVAPDNTFSLFVTADALLAAIIGGFGTLAGPIYGHLFHEVIDGILSTEPHGLARYLQNTLPEAVLTGEVAGFTLNQAINGLLAGRAELYLGIVFILFVLYVPQGILGTIRDRIGGTAAEHLPEHLSRYVRGLRKQ